MNPARLPCTVAPWLLALLLPGCSRGPENATDAKAKLPRFYEGKVSFDGERAGGRLVRVATDSLRVRDEHTLAFERVHFYVLTPLNNEILFDETLPVRGTITVPGLDVALEEQNFNQRVAGVPTALRPGSLHGRLSTDLQAADADWLMTDPNTGQERKAVLKLKAAR
jgi:hypothetical protein